MAHRRTTCRYLQQVFGYKYKVLFLPLFLLLQEFLSLCEVEAYGRPAHNDALGKVN